MELQVKFSHTTVLHDTLFHIYYNNLTILNTVRMYLINSRNPADRDLLSKLERQAHLATTIHRTSYAEQRWFRLSFITCLDDRIFRGEDILISVENFERDLKLYCQKIVAFRNVLLEGLRIVEEEYPVLSLCCAPEKAEIKGIIEATRTLFNKRTKGPLVDALCF
jgi:hypothetical protein